MGSTLVALPAGIKQASSAIPAKSMVTAPNVTASVGLNTKSRPYIIHANIIDTARPRPMPISASVMPWLTTTLTTSLRAPTPSLFVLDYQTATAAK